MYILTCILFTSGTLVLEGAGPKRRGHYNFSKVVKTLNSGGRDVCILHNAYNFNFPINFLLSLHFLIMDGPKLSAITYLFVYLRKMVAERKKCRMGSPPPFPDAMCLYIITNIK